MTKRMRHLVTAVAAIAALATGGAVFAQAQNGGTKAGPASNPAQQKAAPGSESNAPENSATDKDNVQDENGKDDATEASGGAEKADKPGEKGSENPNDDGPGGHADEPGNPNADHQATGAE
jgi:uncharacterized protein HemX